MNDYLIYRFNDMAPSFVWALSLFTGNKFFLDYSFFNTLSFADPINSFINNLIFSTFPPIYSSNFIALLYFLLNLFFSYLLFKNISKKSGAFSMTFALLYSTSLFYIFRVISFTTNLYQVFMFPLVISLLIKKTRPLILGVMLFAFMNLSSYITFFCYCIILSWYFYDLLLKKSSLMHFIKSTLLLLLPLASGLIVFYSSVIYANFPLFGNYYKPAVENISGSMTVYRPIDDYNQLSLRPWYFFIPPTSSTFFGNFARSAYAKISSTNYYLAQNYMEEEMAGAYMGWHFILGCLCTLFLLILSRYRRREFSIVKQVYLNSDLLLRIYFILAVIILISLPASLYINKVLFYTPSYLLYMVVPFFRTLARWSAAIYLLVLIINSYLLLQLYSNLQKIWLRVVFISSLLVISFVMFSINLPIISLNEVPKEMDYLKNLSDNQFIYAVYPKADYYSTFWIIRHNKILLNPANFINSSSGYNSNVVTKEIPTKAGMDRLKSYNTKYLVLYANHIHEKDFLDLSGINSPVSSMNELIVFFKNEFGKVIYDDGGVLIFERL